MLNRSEWEWYSNCGHSQVKLPKKDKQDHPAERQIQQGGLCLSDSFSATESKNTSPHDKSFTDENCIPCTTRAHHLKGKLGRLRENYDRVCETRICLTVWWYGWRTENCSRSLPTMYGKSGGLVRSWWRKTASGPFLPWPKRTIKSRFINSFMIYFSQKLSANSIDWPLLEKIPYFEKIVLHFLIFWCEHRSIWLIRR